MGQAGDSCILKLTVSGAVDANDPDPTHHLFVCRQGGASCAGTQYPLNVTMSSALVQRAYIANQTANSVTVCDINSSTGSPANCAEKFDVSISAPYDVILNSTNTFAYIANTPSDMISICSVNSNGSIGTCSTFADVSLDLNFTGLRINNTGTLLYSTNYNANKVVACPINSNGTLNLCFDVGPVISFPTGRIAFNAAGTRAYVANYVDNTISICTVNVGGTFSSCSTFSDPAIGGPMAVDTDTASTHLYISCNTSPSSVVTCNINNDGSLSACTTSTGSDTFSFTGDVTNLFMKNTLSIAYVPNDELHNISYCGLSNGQLTTCSVFGDSTLHSPVSVWISSY
jgi:6-phosphogluconolactonase (cycloisomerase 2 family)